MAPTKLKKNLFEKSLMVSSQQFNYKSCDFSLKGKEPYDAELIKKIERENEEIFKAAKHEEMKSEINKLKEEFEKLNDHLIIVESERGEAEEHEDAGTFI